MAAPIPVVLFAYARPDHLRRVLACLQAERVPLICAYADGARGTAEAAAVAEVRQLLRAIDWCEVRPVERPENLGLGASVRAGVGEVAARHEAFIVWEDDLVAVPGTYAWMCAALRHYADDPRVLSVSAWTHPLVTPADAGDRSYFDARADCWVWGAWSRSWRGMEEGTALEKMQRAAARGVAPGAYGADLPRMAREERRRNIWAVRWLYHHFERGGLCLRPPWSMVEHIGFDAGASNAAEAARWANPPLRPAPPAGAWPEPVEHAECRDLWQRANPAVGRVADLVRRARGRARRIARAVLPEPVRRRVRLVLGWRWFRGDHPDWASARAASVGYDHGAILEKIVGATREVRAGRAVFERDSVLFFSPDPDRALLGELREIARAAGGRLRVLDFGGSLGSTYWRHRGDLPTGDALRWDVVEQPGFVAAGRAHLADTPLRFFPDVAAAQSAGPHDVLLCSTALQYLEEPFARIEEWSRLGIPWLLLNNLPLTDQRRDRIRVQHVPPSIYAASYPVWFFSRDEFLRRIGEHYTVVKEFESEAQWPVGWGMFQSTGLVLKRRPAP